MRKVIVVFFVLLTSAVNTYSQDAAKLATFREMVLPEYSIYFNHADLDENKQLRLSAVDKYILLSAGKKKAIIARLSKAWRGRLLFVQYGSTTEMWGWNEDNGKTQLLDQWNADKTKVDNAPKGKLNAHPWFIYIGEQATYNSASNNGSLALNARVGCYLLANRWDIAVIGGITSDLDSTYSISYGLISTVHFPIRRCKLSPSVGLQVMGSSYTIGTTSTSTTNNISEALVLGVSWYIGIGSVDFNIAIGSQVSGMGGYTMMPGMMKR